MALLGSVAFIDRGCDPWSPRLLPHGTPSVPPQLLGSGNFVSVPLGLQGPCCSQALLVCAFLQELPVLKSLHLCPLSDSSSPAWMLTEARGEDTWFSVL